MDVLHKLTEYIQAQDLNLSLCTCFIRNHTAVDSLICRLNVVNLQSVGHCRVLRSLDVKRVAIVLPINWLYITYVAGWNAA